MIVDNNLEDIRMLVRIVSFRKGREGMGYTYHAIMNMSDETFLRQDGSFGERDIYDVDVHTFDTEQDARTFVQTHQEWELEVVE